MASPEQMMAEQAWKYDYGRLADVTREEIIRSGLPANSCIAAARVCGFVLHAIGAGGRVEAMACEVDAFSPAYVKMQTRAHELARALTDAEADEYMQAGAWRVSCTFGPPPPGMLDARAGGYHGHVVTLVDRAWMIDPTLPQVNRPAKHLIVEPPYAWPIDYAAGSRVTEAENGTVVFHRLVPGRKDFTKAGDWWRPRPEDPIVARIIARLSTHD